MTQPWHGLLLSMIMLLGISQPTLAKPPAGGSQAQISQSQLIQRIERQYRAKVLKIHKVNQQGKTGYQVKLLQDSGKIRTIFVPDN